MAREIYVENNSIKLRIVQQAKKDALEFTKQKAFALGGEPLWNATENMINAKKEEGRKILGIASVFSPAVVFYGISGMAAWLASDNILTQHSMLTQLVYNEIKFNKELTLEDLQEATKTIEDSTRFINLARETLDNEAARNPIIKYMSGIKETFYGNLEATEMNTQIILGLIDQKALELQQKELGFGPEPSGKIGKAREFNEETGQYEPSKTEGGSEFVSVGQGAAREEALRKKQELAQAQAAERAKANQKSPRSISGTVPQFSSGFQQPKKIKGLI